MEGNKIVVADYQGVRYYYTGMAGPQYISIAKEHALIYPNDRGAAQIKADTLNRFGVFNFKVETA